MNLSAALPPVCRLGLATRGGSRLRPPDVEWAIARGVNYLNWCGHPDGLSQAVAALGSARSGVVLGVQIEARDGAQAATEFERALETLRTDYIDVATLYYVESEGEWRQILAAGGGWDYLERQKRLGRLRMIGLTSHQRKLAARWADSGRLDLLMIRYNAAHRGAERDVFPAARALGLPVVTFTGLRWKALLDPTPEDPPGFRTPSAADCYRFCLADPHVAVTLTAPGNRREIEHNLALLDDWRPPSAEEMAAMRAHGDRTRRHAGKFW